MTGKPLPPYKPRTWTPIYTAAYSTSLDNFPEPSSLAYVKLLLYLQNPILFTMLPIWACGNTEVLKPKPYECFASSFPLAPHVQPITFLNKKESFLFNS